MNEPVFSYYEIVNSVSEMQSRVSGRYLTLNDAEEALKDCCDWYRPKGTGTINVVEFYLDPTSNCLNMITRKVFSVF
ncbi:MAG: hypothetical protein J6W35_07830 [Eubacterium sp.]|nr:hypothetical protein [Eubacterium sp.]